MQQKRHKTRWLRALPGGKPRCRQCREPITDGYDTPTWQAYLLSLARQDGLCAFCRALNARTYP